jgi:class 3 adenylate cyclase
VRSPEVPEVRYAKNGDIHLAYQVFGQGPPDLVFIWGPYSNVEIVWEHPGAARYLTRLASFSRVIHFDKRGTGLSDRAVDLPILEEQMDDVSAVLDDADSVRAAFLGGGDAGMMTMLYAATHPDRTSALVLSDSRAKITSDAECPWGPSAEEWERVLALMAGSWGRAAAHGIVAPSEAGDEGARKWWGRLERHSLSPGSASAIFEMLTDVDLRPVLPTIHVPTLVLHRAGDRYVVPANGRHLAERIPGARYVEFPGEDHPGWINAREDELQELEEFLTGIRRRAEPDRVLATVLFTDIVASTERARELGDRRWRELLDRHDEVASRELERYQGRLVKTTGDGLLATFDGPARAIRGACAIRDAVRGLGLEMRAGLHTGEVEMRGADVGGIAVHIGARVTGLAKPGEVLVSRTVKDLVAGAGIDFAERGAHELKGVPEPWQLYAVTA